MPPQTIRIQLVGENKTQAATAGVDALEKKIDELAAASKKAGEALEDVGEKGAKAGKTTTDSLGRTRDEFGRFIGGAKKAQDAVTGLGNAGAKAGKQTEDGTKKAGQSFKDLNALANTVAGSIAAAFAIDALKDFVVDVVNITAEFQKFEAVLTNTFGSNSRAKVALAQIQQFAAETPFSVQEATQAFIKLQNSGLEPTMKDLKAFADLSANAGKGIDQFAEAANDATRFEFERLKEFFIDASVKGDKVAFTFKNQTVEVDKNAQAIKEYLVSLGELNGVAGATDGITKTLTGQISNLGDAFDRLKVTLGNQNKGIFSFFIQQTTIVTDAINEAIASTEQLGRSYSANTTVEQLTLLESQFKEVAEKTKKSGGDVGLALEQMSDRNVAYFTNNLKEAQKKLDEYIEKNNGFFDKLGRLNPTGRQRYEFTKELKVLSGDVERYKTLIDNIPSIAEKLSKDPAPPKIKGLLEELEAQLKELQKQQKEAYGVSAPAEIKKYEAAIINLQKRIEDLKKVTVNKGLNDRLLIRGGATEDLIKSIDEQTRTQKAGEDELTSIAKEGRDKRIDLDKSYYELKKKADQTAIDEDIKRLEAVEQRKRAIREETFNVSAQFVDALFQIDRDRSQQRYDELESRRQTELRRVGEDAQAKSFINAKFDKEQAKLKTKQAIADKTAALFQIAINTAKAIAEASPVVPLMALAAATGAIQAAVVSSRPIPKFAKGTDFVQRRNGEPAGRDTVLAYVDEGERIIDRETNAKLMGVKNTELPQMAKQFREQAMLRSELREVVRAARETTQAVKSIKIERTTVTEKGFEKWVEQAGAKTKILNNQFSLR